MPQRFTSNFNSYRCPASQNWIICGALGLLSWKKNQTWTSRWCCHIDPLSLRDRNRIGSKFGREKFQSLMWCAGKIAHGQCRPYVGKWLEHSGSRRSMMPCLYPEKSWRWKPFLPPSLSLSLSLSIPPPPPHSFYLSRYINARQRKTGAVPTPTTGIPLTDCPRRFRKIDDGPFQTLPRWWQRLIQFGFMHYMRDTQSRVSFFCFFHM